MLHIYKGFIKNKDKCKNLGDRFCLLLFYIEFKLFVFCEDIMVKRFSFMPDDIII